MKEVETILLYACPACCYHYWSAGECSGETYHCLCSGGYWVWHNGTWEWITKGD